MIQSDPNRIVLSPAQKAKRINLDPDLYGTFAEIGAGQETVRHFFRAGRSGVDPFQDPRSPLPLAGPLASVAPRRLSSP